MNHNFLNSPAKFIYDKEGLAELSYFWQDLYKIKGKCRPDWLSSDGNTVVDLKTTQDASPKGFQKIYKWIWLSHSSCLVLKRIKKT